MDNRLGDMEMFLAVAREGSFAAAAKALRLTPSAISRAMTRIETRLGVQLIRRTTRALTLTHEGERYRDRAAGLLSDIDAIERSIGEERIEARGPLRVNAAVPFGTHCLLPVLPRFLDLHPGITLELALTDAVVDLMEERADIAIRIGPLRDSRLRARKLGRSTMAIVASPAYLARHGEPGTPADLDRHRCLRFTFRRSVDSWPFRIDGRIVHRPVEGPFLGNSGEVVRQMAIAGGGIARLGRFHVAADLRAGRLIELLRAHHPGDGEDIHALYAASERMAPRIGAFLDFVRDNVELE